MKNEQLKKKIKEKEMINDNLLKKLKERNNYIKSREITASIKDLDDSILKDIDRNLKKEEFEKFENSSNDFSKIISIKVCEIIKDFARDSDILKKNIDVFRLNYKYLSDEKIQKDLNFIKERHQIVKNHLKESQNKLKLHFSNIEREITKRFDKIISVCKGMMLTSKGDFMKEVDNSLKLHQKRMFDCIKRLKTLYHHYLLKKIQTYFDTKVNVLYENFIELVEKTKLIEDLMKRKLTFERNCKKEGLIYWI